MRNDHFILHPETRRSLYRHLLPEGASGLEVDEFIAGHHKALLNAESYARRILPFSQRYDTNITLHDAEHSSRVIDNINLVIDLLLKTGFVPTRKEIEILYIAGWFHDIGLLVSGHQDHARCSAEILHKHPDMTDMSVGMSDAVCAVIRSHGEDINDVPE